MALSTVVTAVKDGGEQARGVTEVVYGLLNKATVDRAGSQGRAGTVVELTY